MQSKHWAHLLITQYVLYHTWYHRIYQKFNWYWFIYRSKLRWLWSKVFNCASPASPKDQVTEGQQMKLFLAPWIEQKMMVHNVSVGLPAHKKWLYIVLHSQGHQADFWNQIEFAFAHICTSSDDHLLKIIILKNYHTKAAHVPVEIDSGDFLIAHGASRFLKAEKIMELKRKGKTGPVLHIFILLYPGKWHHCSKPFQN